MNRIKKHLSPFQIIILGFASIIIAGTVLLMLPISSKEGIITSLGDALFTSTSAVCVTGLVVQDTASYWSLFGQGVILILIQTGGLGIVTMAAALVMISGKKIGLMQRSTMQNAISAPSLGGIVRLTAGILKITFIVEFTGACLMLPVFIGDFGIKGIWMAFFHSVSAFCNAGFDLMGIREPFSSLYLYNDNPLINAVIMLLIITGGIGFLVWSDIRTHKLKIRKYSMQTKLVICVSLILIILPAVYFYFCEYSHLEVKERILKSLFQSVAPRTAGFNTANLNELSASGKLITIVLMLIGGSPGSTAGGMKTTTIALLVLSAVSVFKRKENAECFGRRISDNNIKNASTVFLMYIILFLLSSVVIWAIDGFALSECMFEVASAIGTVGSTLGITTKLGSISRLVIIALMFFGRVGGLTIIYAAYYPKNQNLSKKPMENVTVG